MHTTLFWGQVVEVCLLLEFILVMGQLKWLLAKVIK
jgi:hypothetical protein